MLVTGRDCGGRESDTKKRAGSAIFRTEVRWGVFQRAGVFGQFI